MRRRIPPRPGWPAHLVQFRGDDWAREARPRVAWARARFEWARDHPELGEDLVQLLKAARDTRLAAAAR